MSVEIIGAPPRKGKTYWATRKALKSMEKKHNKRLENQKARLKNPDIPVYTGQVFTNYPVFHPTLGYTKVWEEGFEEMPIFDSDIYIDESHRYYNSRKIKNFTSEMHDFFAWSGQRGNNVVLITHDPGRVDTIIREICECFRFARNWSLFGRPIIFFIDSYLSEDEYKQRHTGTRYSMDWFLFSKKVAKSYDTHFFRNEPEEKPYYKDWMERYGLKEPQMTTIRDYLKKCLFRVKSYWT
ncbi:zonular occludens toxin domain-containing protein [Methanolobus sp. ZRKC2]|uniref:zonular occludens toxin domain-containing protein n=1 Tax=Methanolobus sp. ZRKC2 TaxID=3125783 RepID=UPI00324B3C4D